jgi:predicted amidohydrolase YtcJ
LPAEEDLVSRKSVGKARHAGRLGVALLCLAAAFAVALNATGGQHVLVAAGVNDLNYAPPQIILYNGKVSTENAKNETAQALAIRSGTILAAGANDKIKALAGKQTLLVDLGGRRVLPGLDDAHLHGLRNGYHCFTNSPRLEGIYTRTDAIKYFAVKSKHIPAGQWVWITSGWNINQFTDKQGMFTLAELDQAFPNNPVDFRAAGFAGSQTNTKGLQALGLTASNPTGQLTGAGQQAADAQIIAQINGNSIEKQASCLKDFIRDANAAGLTGWVDPGGNQAPFNPSGGCEEALSALHDHQAVVDMWMNGQLNARVPYYEMNHYAGYAQAAADQRHASGFLGDDMLRTMGVGEEVECPGGGVLAGPSQNVADQAADYKALTEFLASNRLSLQHHASSKAAQDSELSFWVNANKIYPIEKLRWFIAHPGDDGVSPTADTLAVAKQLGVGMVPGDSGALGTGTARALIGNIQRAGVRMCLGVDAMNVAPYQPFGDLWYVVSGETLDPASPGIAIDQRLTRQQALDGKTKDCAWFFKQDNRLGRIAPGYHADVIVLDRDYFTVPAHEIRSIKSLLTIVDGRIVWGSPRGPWAKLDPCYTASGGQAWVDAAKSSPVDTASC